MTDGKQQIRTKGLPYVKGLRLTDGHDGISTLVTADRALRVRELMTPGTPSPPSAPARTLAERAAGRVAAEITRSQPD